MSSYTFTSEQAKTRTITTVEEAKSVIIATATSRMHDRASLIKDKDLNEVAHAFGLHLTDVDVQINNDPNDFPFTYSFN